MTSRSETPVPFYRRKGSDIIFTFGSEMRYKVKFHEEPADKTTGEQMPTPMTTFGETVWMLPPLILHPFNERVPPSALLENSKAALMLSGLIPSDGSDA